MYINEMINEFEIKSNNNNLNGFCDNFELNGRINNANYIKKLIKINFKINIIFDQIEKNYNNYCKKMI